jgi:hypothetical protein
MRTYQQANCHQDHQAAITVLEALADQEDPADQADLEALADQRHITQLEHQEDLKALAVLEDLEAQAVQAAPADQVIFMKS